MASGYMPANAPGGKASGGSKGARTAKVAAKTKTSAPAKAGQTALKSGKGATTPKAFAPKKAGGKK